MINRIRKWWKQKRCKHNHRRHVLESFEGERTPKGITVPMIRCISICRNCERAKVIAEVVDWPVADRRENDILHLKFVEQHRRLRNGLSQER